MKSLNAPGKRAAICLFTLFLCLMWGGAAFAAIHLPGLSGQGRKSVTRDTGGTPKYRGFKQPVTITHPTRNFRYTIPAGWGIVLSSGDTSASNDPNNVDHDKPHLGNVVLEGKRFGPCNFTITIEQMVKTFPRAAAAAAGLKKDMEEIKRQNVQETKRRDQGDPKKACSFLGWQTTQASTSHYVGRHILYEGYDQDNIHYIFDASSKDEYFEECRADLLKIIESVQFCVK